MTPRATPRAIRLARHVTRSRTAVLPAVAVLALVAVVGGPAQAAHLTGTNHHDRLVGTTGADVIGGAGGNDTILALGGPDRVSGGSGNDSIDGAGGDDTLRGDLGNDVVDGGDGNDSIGTAPPRQGPQAPDNDRASGGAGNDVIATGAGNDRLDGGDGADYLTGDTGHDVLVAGAGADKLNGGDGPDRVDGGSGGDWLQGGAGDDLVIGGSGDDHPQGGPGNDRVYGGTGRNELDGDDGDDFIDGGSGPESCASVRGPADFDGCHLRLTGAASREAPINPNITGDAGDDVIYPGGDIDVAFGEEGFDTFVVTDDGAYDRLFCSDGQSEPHPPAARKRGRVIYVGQRDPLDDLRNCASSRVRVMSARAFLADDTLVYPGTHRHLPLPK